MLMRNPFKFFVELMQQPIWIPAWVMALMVVNIASLGFWSESLAKAILITFMISAMLMMGLYSRFGFEKVLSMGHILWIPLLVYVLIQIPNAASGFKSYLMIWSLFTAISLVFDVVDVWKYFTTQKTALSTRRRQYRSR